MFFPQLFYGFQLLQELVWFALLVIVIATVTAARGEPDPGRRRLTATFLAVVMGASLTVAVVASSVAVGSLASLLRDDEEASFSYEGEEFEEDPFADGEDPGREDEYATILYAGLVTLAAGGVFFFHRRKLDGLLADEAGADSAAAAVAEGYRHIVSFLALVAVAGGAATAATGLAKVAVPDVFSADEADIARRVAAGTFFVGGWLAAVGYGVLDLHRSRNGTQPLDDADGEEPEPGPPVEEAPIP